MRPIYLPILALPLLASCGKSDDASTTPAALGTRMADPFQVTSAPNNEIAKAEYIDLATDTPVEITDAKGDKWKKKANGLQYRELQEGKGGAAPEIGQAVQVKFASYHLDMSPIQDNLSEYHAEQFRFIQGKKGDALPLFSYAVQGLLRNGRRRLQVPPELAYGAEGNAKLHIKPNETLIFDVELASFSGTSRDEAAKAATALTQPATLPSDLLIEDLKLGDGALAEPGKNCTLKFTGKLADGSTFDSGEFSFVIGSHTAIDGFDGFDLGTRGMKVNGKRKITVPSRLGYGTKGSGSKVPPNATLTFEVELTKVQ